MAYRCGLKVVSTDTSPRQILDRERVVQGGNVCKVGNVFAAVILASLMLTTLATAASVEKVIYSFRGGADGGDPTPTLLAAREVAHPQLFRTMFRDKPTFPVKAAHPPVLSTSAR
jgi:hypothetical protein